MPPIVKYKLIKCLFGCVLVFYKEVYVSEQGLFRANALKQQAAKLDGDVIIAQPLSSSVLTIILMLLVFMLVAFLALSSFNRKETVTGYLKPDLGLAKVGSPRPGIVVNCMSRMASKWKRGCR
ncbi:hypothetical protein ABC502_10565 [Alkalimonas sp. NCh-2]|uniref:hypothetical protein n=1 Tax=Alkalimonas sp. NCh-2 TaxID=3144846 RepID=UPI0031F65297